MKAFFKKAFVLCVGCCVLVSAVSIAEAQQCSVQFVGEHDAKIKVGKRNITVLGWEHLDEEDTRVLAEGYKSAVSAMQMGDCASAKAALADAIQKQNRDLISAQNIYKKLSEINKTKPFSILGVELAPSEMRNNLYQQQGIERNLSFMEMRCPGQLTESIAAFRLMIPGPEYLFANQSQSSIELKPLEDEEAKAANQQQMIDGGEPFDFDNPKITIAGRQAIAEVQKNILQSKMPHQNLLNTIVAYEKDPLKAQELKLSLQKSLELWLGRIKGAYQRNVSIADTVLKQHGDAVIVIGHIHVNHLSKEIVKQCKEPPLPIRTPVSVDVESAPHVQ